MKNKKHKRVETGTLQFGDDWPCIVMRGKDAAYFALILKQHLDDPKSTGPVENFILKGLQKLLAGSKVTTDGKLENVQYVKDYNEVVVDNEES